jgi:hypothetical protein
VLQVFLDGPFLIAPSVFSTFIFILSVLQVSLDRPFLIAPSVFSTVYFHPAGVTSVSGWSILDRTFGFL